MSVDRYLLVYSLLCGLESEQSALIPFGSVQTCDNGRINLGGMV